MTTLDRYVIGRVLRAFLPSLLGLALVFFTAAVFKLLRDEDMSLRQIGLALPTLLPYLLPYLLPVAFALGGALALSRLADQRELLALSALGVSRRTVLRPAWLLGLPLAAGSLLLTAEVAPAAYRARRQVAKAVLLQLASGEHVSRTHQDLGLRIYARRIEGQRLEGLLLHQQARPGSGSAQLVARAGELSADDDGLALELRQVDLTLLPPADAAAPGPIRVRLPLLRQPLSADAQSGRLRVESHGSAELRRLAQAAPARDPLDTRLKAQLELGSRLLLGLAPLLVGLTTFPLVVRMSHPLVATALGAVVGCAAAFGPLLLARTLAESLRQPAWLALGLALPLLVAAALSARLEARA